jgi:hypothetical protein
MVKGAASRDAGMLGEGAYNLVSAIVMPRYDSHGGINWPGTSSNQGLIPGSAGMVNLSSSAHDRAVGQPGGFWQSSNHFNWIGSAWMGPGVQPGIYGNAYRALGTVGFGVAATVLRSIGR